MPTRITALIFLALSASTALAQTTPSVRGILNPRRITVGGQATFRLETTGAPAKPPERAIRAEGLAITYDGRSSSVQIVNGKRSERYSYIYSVHAASAGRFTIPPVKITVGGTVFTTDPQGTRRRRSFGRHRQS